MQSDADTSSPVEESNFLQRRFHFRSRGVCDFHLGKEHVEAVLPSVIKSEPAAVAAAQHQVRFSTSSAPVQRNTNDSDCATTELAPFARWCGRQRTSGRFR